MNTQDDKKIMASLARLTAVLRAPTLETVGRDLADFFDVDAIGMCTESDPGPQVVFQREAISLPELAWRNNAELTVRLGESLSAEAFRDDAGVWLITKVWEVDPGTEYLVWAFRKTDRGRTELSHTLWSFASRGICRRHLQEVSAQAVAKEANARLELAAAMASRLSHDFGNHLTGIMGFTELSMFQLATESVPYRYMQEVLQAARVGAEWIHRIHQFTRRQAQPGWPAVVSHAIEAEEARLRLTDSPHVHWQKEMPADLPLVAIEAASLQAILAELVANAWEAAKGEVTVRLTARVVELGEAEAGALLGAARSGPHVELTVSNDGPGIPREHQGRLLRDIFFSTKPKHRGLGLLIAYGHLRRAGGGMRLAFGSEDTGPSVQLYLPVIQLDFPARSEAPSVLLVHSDVQALASLRTVLEADGCRVTSIGAHQTALGINLAAKPSFALIIMEMQSPQMNGVDLSRRILERNPSAHFLFLADPAATRDPSAGILLKRFPGCPWPVPIQAFLKSVHTALGDPDGAV